jgi:hypothetical protein
MCLIVVIFFYHRDSCVGVADILKEICFIGVFYLPTDAQESCFEKSIKFTLKQLRHVSV